jgi:hypothetical protein
MQTASQKYLFTSFGGNGALKIDLNSIYNPQIETLSGFCKNCYCYAINLVEDINLLIAGYDNFVYFLNITKIEKIIPYSIESY